MSAILMGAREDLLTRAMEGYRLSGISPICHSAGQFLPCNKPSDDIGLYYFLPKFAKFFGLEQFTSTYIFLQGVAFFASLVGIYFFFKLYKSAFLRILIVADIFILQLFVNSYLDVYVFYAATALVFVPLILLLVRRRSIGDGRLAFWFFLIGLALGVSNIFRLHSGNTVAIFAITLVACNFAYSKKVKAAVVICLALGLLVPKISMNHQLALADKFLDSRGSAKYSDDHTHLIWHQIYIGFGYLDNPYGLHFADRVGFEKAMESNPKIELTSKEYDDSVRAMVLRFTAQHPNFVLRTIFAKLGICMMYFLVFANFGFFFGLKNNNFFKTAKIFSLAIIFSLLPGLLTVPGIQYMFSFAVLSIVLGIECLAPNEKSSGENPMANDKTLLA
jgi:hypothetical protein